MRGRLVITIIGLALGLCRAGAEDGIQIDWIGKPTGKVVYESHFDKDDLTGWAVVENTRPLSLNKSDCGHLVYLGEFHNDVVRLDLKNLPTHQLLIVECDLLILKTWGGSETNNDKDGPDLFTVRLAGGPTLLHASFSGNHQLPQSYPDPFPAARHAGLTGATRTALPGLPAMPNPDDGTNALYRLRLLVSHTAANTAVEFLALLTENLPQNLTTDNESWALANVRVSVADTPLTKVDEKQFEKLWSALDNTDAVAANRAVWELVSAGHAVVPMIAKRLGATDALPATSPIARLIANLDADDFKTREQATQQLRELGTAAVPQLENALAKNPSPEVRMRLKQILQSPQAHEQNAPPARRRAVLELIDGTEARKLLERLPGLPTYKPRVDVDLPPEL